MTHFLAYLAGIATLAPVVYRLVTTLRAIRTIDFEFELEDDDGDRYDELTDEIGDLQRQLSTVPDWQWERRAAIEARLDVLRGEFEDLVAEMGWRQ